MATETDNWIREGTVDLNTLAEIIRKQLTWNERHLNETQRTSANIAAGRIAYDIEALILKSEDADAFMRGCGL